MHTSVITIEVKENENISAEPSIYYFEHDYRLEIESDEEYLYAGEEFLGVKMLINVSARHGKVYKRDGKVLSEDLIDEFVEFQIDDPGVGRLSAVVQALNTYVQANPWLQILLSQM